MILYTFLTVFSSKKEKKIAFSPDEIKNLRQALGLTQAEFAKKFSVSQSLVAQWETGLRRPTTDVHKILEQRRSEIPTDLEHRNINTPLKIKALREALGLTQAALSSKLKISKRLVRYWETGKRSPSPFFQAKLKRLASALRNKSANSEGEQIMTSEEGEQIVTSEEEEQIITSEEEEQIITSEEEEQIITSEEEEQNITTEEQEQNFTT